MDCKFGLIAVVFAACAPTLVICDVGYTSCAAAKSALGANATDQEYVIYPPAAHGIGIPIYCADMKGSTPTEYLTLRAGIEKNYASYYSQLGMTTRCANFHPVQSYSAGGSTKYKKVRLDIRTFMINTSDTRFTQQSGGSNKIRFANAGDKYASSAQCQIMGHFKTDFAGTPFVVSPSVQWTWTGKFVRGSQTTGVAHITNSTYIGCFVDASDRLLPSAFTDSKQMTVEYCTNYCNGRGFKYAGVQFYSQCFCGDNYLKHIQTANTACNTPCRGNPAQKCGGTWRISVYGTGLPQAIAGKCGGYPGQCFPALKSNPQTEALAVQIISTHPCLNNPCKYEGKCVAITASDFRCVCHDGYSGTLCDRPKESIILGGAACPPGMQAEKCNCAKRTCTGAKFVGDNCVTPTGLPRVVCRIGDPGHVILYNVNTDVGVRSVTCPKGSEMTGCSYWDRSQHKIGDGEPDVTRYQTGQCSISPGCQNCTMQARCKKYDCGCKNNGHCNKVTGTCACPDGYYGQKCENFDYCTFYTNQTGQPACGDGGQCTAIPQNDVLASRGDQRGSYCIFPFTYNGTQFGSCVSDNEVGPPFACGSKFDGSKLSYVDLGQWSPGPVYTIAAWVRPGIADGNRRTIIGGVGACKDFGIYHFQTFWAYYKGVDDSCTRGINSGVQIVVGEWYLLAVVGNNTHITFYVNGKAQSVSISSYTLGTTQGFWIGGEQCCPSNRFLGMVKGRANFLGTTEGMWIGGEHCCGGHYKGMIKTVKIWKRALSYQELTTSMNTRGNSNSLSDALNGGLVGHWELGESLPPLCKGTDHGGADWIPADGDVLTGVHCNISRFYIPRDVSVLVKPYKRGGNSGGLLDILAQDIEIDGILDGSGAGYSGGLSPSGAGSDGIQGDSYSGAGGARTVDNRGGGGGGAGGGSRADGSGKPGGGGGYGTVGKGPLKLRGDHSGLGTYGKMYGDETLQKLYIGSGGGSGGNAKDLSVNPPGGRGGNGGGAIRLRALRNVLIGGIVTVAGMDGQGDAVAIPGCIPLCPKDCDHKSLLSCSGNSTSACWDSSGPGGGGSGGSLFISGKVVNVGQRSLLAMGGSGGYGTLQGCGGDGGMGRIRVEYVILKGSLTNDQGAISKSQLQNQFTDHSYEGQARIDYQNTVYGNEVYLGCFTDNDVNYRTLAHTVSLTSTQSNNMTPQLCMTLCRKAGYKYSGTEYSKECFCDNHLDVTRKVIDSQCNMHCRGDSKQTCGDSFRVQVFGPHPGVSAVGHQGAVQTCDPWCVTADDGTSNPKWGICQLNTDTVTKWKTLCQCPAGKQGAHCQLNCDDGFYGNDCAYNCTCMMNNTAVCDPVSGACRCKPGYQGNMCESVCPQGKYGMGCSGVCNCTGNSRCDFITGACLCPAGFTGPACNFPCPSGYWGGNCSNHCPCNGHGACDPVYGTCNCDPGYTNQFCGVTCDPGAYGINCGQDCDCNFSPCDPVTGECQCKPGKTGRHCRQDCPYGMYGDKCATPCPCPMGCDSVTGQCQCPPGYFGKNCQLTCPQGTYGRNCQSRCACVMANTDTCNIENGLCSCKPGFTGHRCELACPTGYYGSDCNNTCSQCQHRASCDSVNGTCICKPGFKGADCEIPCPAGYYGDHCTGVCPTCNPGVCSKATGLCICQNGVCTSCPAGYYGNNCASVCSCVHGKCDKQGNCQCDSGWQGSNCEQPCPPGKYGVNCQKLCTCLHGTCHPGTGVCVCQPGYGGLTCYTPCQNYTYGPGCIHTCNQCVHGKSCDPVTGMCSCAPGYRGVLCGQKCVPGNYGQDCKLRCNCQNGGTCDNVDGSCSCPYGYTGSDCSQKCQKGRFGMNCTQTCSCSAQSTGCDPETGQCNCLPGYTGEQCEHSCPRGTWGQGCNNVCKDVCSTMGTETCSPINGACRCKPGYTGMNCSSACPTGSWGRNCVNTCTCNGRGKCDLVTGSCDCDPGYNGSSCQTVCSSTQTWGKRCSHLCNCNGAPCNPVDGRCECPAGKKGHHCEQECSAYYFGINCVQPCRCQNGAICDKTTGACTCQPGWAGTFCENKCDDGYFGAGCDQQCPVCYHGGSCDPATGQCQCAAGYTGINCQQMCPVGYYGLGCGSKCPSVCPHNCQPDVGVCKCTPGSCLNGGVCNSQGVCQCAAGYEGDRCSQTTGQSARLVNQAPQSGGNNSVSLSNGSVAGLAVGIVVAIALMAILIVLGMRRYYTGRFLRSATAVRYDHRDSVNEPDDDDGMRGFSNPQYEESRENRVAAELSSPTHENETDS